MVALAQSHDRHDLFFGQMTKRGERLLYCDHIDGDGEGLFRLTCEHDREGIVATCKSEPYLPEHTRWLKIRTQAYSQWPEVDARAQGI